MFIPMIILNKSECQLLKSILAGKDVVCPTFVYSILDNFIPGTVYADNGHCPGTVLFKINAGIYFVLGDVTNKDFKNFLVELLRQRKKAKLRFTLFSASEDWDVAIKDKLGEEIKQLNRLTFTYDTDAALAEKRLPCSAYSIVKINEDMIKNSLEFNQAYYEEYWGSVSNFIENGRGFCIVHEGKVISECTSIFSSRQYAEMDIVTHPAYRGQGLASIVAGEFIKDCLENSIVPKWDCDVANRPSIQVAEKLGFVNPRQYSIFI